MNIGAKASDLGLFENFDFERFDTYNRVVNDKKKIKGYLKERR